MQRQLRQPVSSQVQPQYQCEQDFQIQEFMAKLFNLPWTVGKILAIGEPIIDF